MNEDYGTVLSPTEVRFQRLLPGPIETVWAFLTDSKKRGEWFASGPMEPRVGNNSHCSPIACVLSENGAAGPSGNWLAWQPQTIKNAGRP